MSKNVQNEVVVVDANVELKNLLDKMTTTSSKMRYLVNHFASEKSAIGSATKWLNTFYIRADGKQWRFQHVRNVMKQVLKKTA